MNISSVSARSTYTHLDNSAWSGAGPGAIHGLKKGALIGGVAGLTVSIPLGIALFVTGEVNYPVLLAGLVASGASAGGFWGAGIGAIYGAGIKHGQHG